MGSVDPAELRCADRDCSVGEWTVCWIGLHGVTHGHWSLRKWSSSPLGAFPVVMVGTSRVPFFNLEAKLSQGGHVPPDTVRTPLFLEWPCKSRLVSKTLNSSTESLMSFSHEAELCSTVYVAEFSETISKRFLRVSVCYPAVLRTRSISQKDDSYCQPCDLGHLFSVILGLEGLE